MAASPRRPQPAPAPLPALTSINPSNFQLGEIMGGRPRSFRTCFRQSRPAMAGTSKSVIRPLRRRAPTIRNTARAASLELASAFAKDLPKIGDPTVHPGRNTRLRRAESSTQGSTICAMRRQTTHLRQIKADAPPSADLRVDGLPCLDESQDEAPNFRTLDVGG